jgi:PBP1b-binding outer membrane lipoprotein LpoB
MTTNNRCVLATAVLLTALGLSGCGKEKAAKQSANPFAGVPFVLTPGPDGSLQPRTPDDKPIPPSQTPPADAIKTIRGLSQVAVLKIEGSCYYLIYANGQWYKVPC